MVAPCERRRSSAQARIAPLGKGTSALAPPLRNETLEQFHELHQPSDERGHRIRRRVMTNAQYGKLVAGLIAAWFVFTLAASGLHVFRSDFSRPAILFALAGLTPIAVFAVWSAASKGFRQFTES